MKPLLGKAIGIFLAVAGLLGVIVQFVTTPGKLGWGALLSLFVILVLLGIWIIGYSLWRDYRTSRALPQLQKLDEISVGYRVAAADRNDVEWIARQEEEVYSSTDAVPRHVLLEWYDANPNGFSVIKMADGVRIGHLDILPLRPATLSKFIEGNIVEKDIRGDSLYAAAERDQIKNLYVESIAVVPPKGYSNAPAVLSVLVSFGDIIKRLSEPTTVENVYAIAASTAGKRLLEKLGFEKIKYHEDRADKHDLYRVALTDLEKKISMMCGHSFLQLR